MPLNSCSARAVSCSVGHRTFDVILVSAIILEGIVVVAIIVASVYEVKAQMLRKPSQQSSGKLATLFFFAVGFAARIAMFAIEFTYTANYKWVHMHAPTTTPHHTHARACTGRYRHAAIHPTHHHQPANRCP